jgi:hypothetical protein
MTQIAEIHLSTSPESRLTLNLYDLVRRSLSSLFGVLTGHFRTAIQLFAIPHNYAKRCKFSTSILQS